MWDAAPGSAWLDEYYQAVEEKLFVYKDKYKENNEALHFAEMDQAEMDLYRKYAVHYGDVFYVMQKEQEP